MLLKGRAGRADVTIGRGWTCEMTLLAEKHKLLWLGQSDLPDNVSAAVSDGWDISTCDLSQAGSRRFGEAEVVLIAPSAEAGGEGGFDARWLSEILDRIDRSGAVAVVLLPAGLAKKNLLAHRRGQFIVADADASPAELAACIESAAALQPAIKHLQADVAAVRSFPAGDNFEELDEEMRLAARLQRDFLPQLLPQVWPVRFAVLFRPAGWVSGDIYDIFRLDETNIGFYVADVVGHGMPAALLTMFVKKALQTKQIAGDRYEIISPHEALAGLNADIYRQHLNSCQFCTAVYGIVNTETLLLRYACGGHPSPLLLDAAGAVRRLEAVGPLLGVFPGETFGEQEVHLNYGDRLVVFSDGAEEMLSFGPESSGGSALVSALQGMRHLGAEEMVLQLTAQIDGCRQPARHDDVTVLVMDICA